MFTSGRVTVVVACLALLLISSPVARAADETKLSGKDKNFIIKATEGGMMEVKMGELADKNGSDAGVKEFGQMMVTDHSKQVDEVKQLAQTKGVDLPKDMDEKVQKKADKLAKMSGADFDKAYMKDTIKDHEKDISEFEKAAKDCKDDDVKAWADKQLPTLKSHLDKAKQVADKLGVKS